ncbi:hypothetical protein ABZ920_01555 [Streptomyces sp. NPDC046831]|uniref:hypothetical protein n=1 Tax=Streptomyces sp. NPDC046831 TaxID=3154805 RepID=UPI0033E8ABA7
MWWRERPSPAWELIEKSEGISLVRNTSQAAAHDVRVRAGSAANPGPDDHRVQADTVGPGEVVRVISSYDMGDPADWAVEVTWRGRFGRRHRWTYLVR